MRLGDCFFCDEPRHERVCPWATLSMSRVFWLSEAVILRERLNHDLNYKVDVLSDVLSDGLSDVLYDVVLPFVIAAGES